MAGRRMGTLLSVNLAAGRNDADAPSVGTGIDKRPVEEAVRLFDPGPKGVGASGVEGDAVWSLRHHGGSDQAVYAYAREDLDLWQAALGRRVPPGTFGENLTTLGVDITGARIGERWRLGDEVVVAVTGPRIPCQTFARWMGERGWVRRFTERGLPGAYLRVVVPGWVRAGDAIALVARPEHDVTVAIMFRALTTRPDLLPALLVAGEALPTEIRDAVAQYAGRQERAGGRAGSSATTPRRPVRTS